MEDALTRAVWEFMAGAYRRGLLDEMLSLAGMLLDPEIDLGTILGDFEDNLTAADFGPFEEMSRDVLLPTLQALSREEVLDGLRVIITGVRPFVERAVQASDGNGPEIGTVVEHLRRHLQALRTVGMALLPVVAKVYGPAVGRAIAQQGGGLAAEAVNAAAAAVEKNPETATRFIADLFAGVDGRAFRSAADTLLGAVLDQRPPLVGWAAATVVTRARNRVLSGRGGR